MQDEKTSGLSPRSFGVVIGVIIAAAIAMFAGLYLLGSQSASGSFDSGYDAPYNYTNSADTMGDAADDYYYNDAPGYYTTSYPETDTFYATGDYTEFVPLDAATTGDTGYYYYTDASAPDYQLINE